MWVKKSGICLFLCLVLFQPCYANDLLLAKLEEAGNIIRHCIMQSDNMMNTITLQKKALQEAEITIANLKLDKENLVEVYEKQVSELTKQLNLGHKKLNESKLMIDGLTGLLLWLLFL